MARTSLTHPTVRKVAGFFTGMALCAGAIGLVVPAFADPGPPALVGRALNIAAVESGRSAYLAAMKAQGYEILPAVQISQLAAPAP